MSFGKSRIFDTKLARRGILALTAVGTLATALLGGTALAQEKMKVAAIFSKVSSTWGLSAANSASSWAVATE